MSWTPTRASTPSVKSPLGRTNGHGERHAATGASLFASATSTSARRAGIPPPATASPQVRARLAELRKAKAAQAAAAAGDASVNTTLNGDGESRSVTPELSGAVALADTDTVSLRRASSSAQTLDGSVGPSQAGRPETPVEITFELGMRTLQQEIDKAKKSGRLNISARSLEELPPLVFEQLLPKASIYHPSNAGPPKCFSSRAQKLTDVDLSASSTSSSVSSNDSPSPAGDTADTASPRWWEVEDLISLKASNNDLAEIPSSIAGFPTLQVLDLHMNKLKNPLPASLGTLVNLTTVNLSNNGLDEWPVELMALVHLKELDLSHNKLHALWNLDWKTGVKERLKTVKKDTRRMMMNASKGDDPDTSFDSVSSQSTAGDSSAGEDFWAAYSQAPVNTRAAAYMRTADETDYTQPLPKLRTLNLSHNRLAARAFSLDCISSLPPALITLNLASNGISGCLPLDLFGSLSHLQSLILADNGLDDAFWTISSPSSGTNSNFRALTVLDLSRNALDSLEYLEIALTRSMRRSLVYKGVTSTSLSKALSVDNVEAGDLPRLSIDLTENFLREELPRRKRMRRDARQGKQLDESEPNSKQDSSSRASETDAEQLRHEAESILDSLEQCKTRIRNRLDNNDMSLGLLAQIRKAVQQVTALVDTDEEAKTPLVASFKALQVSDNKPSGPTPARTPDAKTSIVHSSTPAKVNQPGIAGSARARRRALDAQAEQWAPL